MLKLTMLLHAMRGDLRYDACASSPQRHKSYGNGGMVTLILFVGSTSMLRVASRISRSPSESAVTGVRCPVSVTLALPLPLSVLLSFERSGRGSLYRLS
jgi:hypothetical protein